MKKFFPFTRRKGSADIRTKGGGGNEGGTRTGRHDANRHSIGSYSSVSNRSMVIQLIRGAYNIDLAKVDQSFTKLHKSCFLNQDLNKIRKYLKQGANPNQLDNVSRSSPLHLATVNGNINVIRLLIEHGGNIDLTDGDGKTLAIKAVECFHKECLQFLILQGADLNVGDNLTGNTVLHWSIVNNFPDGLRLCLAYSGRIDVNRKNKLGESALHLLVKYPDLRGFISDLLDKGAEIDLRNNLQQTPLMVACEHGHLEAARALINRGSYIYLQDESGFTALGIAQRNGHVALVQYLTDLGGFDQPNRRESQVTRNELKSTAIDSWPSTEEEDENEIAEKTRKFDPIIQQLKSLQGGVGENGKQMPKLLQSIEPNQQQMRRSGIKANNDQEQSTSSSANQLKPSLSQQQQQQQQSNYGKGQSMASNTRIVADDDDDDDDDNEDDDNTMMTDKLNNSMKISNGDNRVTSESRSTVKAVDLVPQNLTSLGHIDSVYSHGTSNDEFIKEIKNLLDEEIRENDELDALLFSTSFNSPANVTKITTSLIGQQNVNDDADVDDQSTYQQDNHQLTRKIVNNKSESIQQPSALRELSPLPFSSQPATSTNNFNSKSSTTDHVNLKGGQSKSKNVIHVDILSDLWEDWEEDEGKSDVEDEGKMKIEASSLLPETAIKTISSKSHIKDSISTPESTAQPSPPSPPPPPPPPAIQSNGQEVLGTFFLNNISDDEDEDESNVEIDLGDELPMKVNGQASRGRNMKEDGDKVEDNDQNGEDKRRKEGEVKKDGKSSEAERIRRNLVVKEDGNVFSSSTTHQPETFSSSLTPILRFEAISSSIDKKSNANLITSQSSSSPPLPPPPPPPPVSFTPLSPPLSTTGSSFPPPPPPPLPPALPPRPSNRLTIDNLKDKSIDLHRTSTEVQTELDQLTPRLTELERLWMESENKVKTLEIQLSKQAREADEDCNQLRAKIKCLEKDKKLLENQLVEMKESEERLMSEKKVLTLREAKLLKQLDSYEECKCSELKLELKAVKESVKSRRNHNNDEFIRKLHDLNDECNDLRRELTAEQTSLKEEINQLEKEKEMFKLENQWLKDKLDEMRIQMRKHFLLSSDDQMKVSLTPSADQLDQNQKESDGRSGKFKRKQDKDGEEGEEDDDDGHLSVNDRNETLGEMRKTMVSVESLCRKLDDKISTLNLEEQKKLMEKIIVEIAKTQINRQVETMFKGIRSLLEDLHRELISFQVTIEKQQQQQQQSQQFNSYNQVQQSADDNEKVNLDDENDDDFHHDHQEKQLKDESSSCSTTTKKIISNGFSVFESRISQLTSSIEKLEDNIERQELNMLIQARGHFWSALTDPMGINMDTEHYRQDVNNNSLLINLINSTDCSKQSIQRRPQSVFVQSLMRLQKTPVDSKTNYPKLIHNQNSTNNYLNYEPSIVGDFHFTKNNLSKQIAHLKSELGLSR